MDTSQNGGRVKMPERPAAERVSGFDEVALGYTPEQALEEAKRCRNCQNPRCVTGCPVNVPIPHFIKLLTEGRGKEAFQTITEQNALPAICGRVCPQESQCEGKCILGIKGEPVAIGRLERYAAGFSDDAGAAAAAQKQGRKVAVIGSGPASLTCAGELARKGYDVTVFEALHAAGGVLVYGIPEFRLPKDLVRKEIARIESLGVRIVTDVVVGKSITIDDLFSDGFAAIFIGTGAGLPKFMNIPGENLNGVYSANEFLTRCNLMKAYDFPRYETPIWVGKHAAVLGGGNVAMDSARVARRLGAEHVAVVYRRGEEEMPARREEYHHAREEGITFEFLTNPVRILGQDGWVAGLECVRMQLGEPDASGRRRPIEIPDSQFTLPVDTVIVAIGQSPNPLLRQTTKGLEAQPWGGLITDEETMATSRPGVFAGGDAVTGAATVISAMGAGKKAARSIDAYLSKESAETDAQ